MSSKAVITAIVAMSLTTGGSALAQGKSDRGERARSEKAQRGDPRDGRKAREPNRREIQERANRYEGREEHGAGPYHSFRKGDRLPPEYRHRNYVIDDWHAYHLSRPPRGHQWVQIGGEFVLVAIGTGIIVQIVLNP